MLEDASKRLEGGLRIPDPRRLTPPSPLPLPHRRPNERLDSAAHVKVAHDFDPWRRQLGVQVIEDAVHGALVKDPVIAIAPQIELETLELDAEPVRDVCDHDRAEVGRAPFEQGELGRIALDPAKRTQRGDPRMSCEPRIPVRDTIRKGLDKLGLRHRGKLKGGWTLDVRRLDVGR